MFDKICKYKFWSPPPFFQRFGFRVKDAFGEFLTCILYCYQLKLHYSKLINKFKKCSLESGAYISENSTHYYLPDWAYLGQKIRPKHNEGVVWSQNKGHFWTQHAWKPLYRLLVWPYLWILIFWIFYFWSYLPNWGTTRNLLWVVGGNIRPWAKSHYCAMRMFIVLVLWGRISVMHLVIYP